MAWTPEHSGVHKLAELYPPEPLRKPDSIPPFVRDDRPTELRVVLDEHAPAKTPAAPGLSERPPGDDLGLPELYLNRELGYLNFQWRVLHEAADDRTPLLERVKFLSIVASNIDEFFQKRI